MIDKNNETMLNTLALISDQYEPAAYALRKANIIIMFGNGDAIIPCQLISLKLMKIGKACVVLNDQDMQVFCASSMRFGDVALAVSHTGRSKSVVEAMRIARERGAITIGVTAAAKSPLLKHCSYALLTGTVDDTTARGHHLPAHRRADGFGDALPLYRRQQREGYRGSEKAGREGHRAR